MKTKLTILGVVISVIVLSLSLAYVVAPTQYNPDQDDTAIACGTGDQNPFGHNPDDDLCDDIRGKNDSGIGTDGAG